MEVNLVSCQNLSTVQFHDTSRAGGVKSARLGVGVEIAPNFLNFCHSESVARDDPGYY